jgi:hypothetical protein
MITAPVISKRGNCRCPDGATKAVELRLPPPLGLAISSGPRLGIEVPTPLATVHNNQAYTVSGTAYDPSATSGTGVDRVSVDLNVSAEQLGGHTDG